MPLTNNDYKKIGATLLLLMLLGWVYVTNYRAPTLLRAEALAKQMVDLRAQVAAARDQVARANALAASAPAAEEVFAFFSQFTQDGEPIAWFPPQIAAFFDRHGIANVTSRIGTSAPVGPPELGQFELLNWTIDLPQVAYGPLGFSLAALENENPMLEIRSLRIDVPEGNPEFQRAQLGAVFILKPRE